MCAVGGTINEDDHVFGLSAAKKYGGIYVPPHIAVIHQYAREMLAGCNKMILGSDSHTRYGALGTMAIGEGGPEIVKQLLNRTYDINMPEVIGIYLTGKPQKGVGPQDIALAIIGKVFANGYVNNKVMEFIGDGVDNLSVDYRIGIDVMTTETTCLSSIWKTDSKVKDFFEIHGRKEEYAELNPGSVTYYDGMVYVDLSKIKPMIAMPFHPSNVYTIDELVQCVDRNKHIIICNNSSRGVTSKANIKTLDELIHGKYHEIRFISDSCDDNVFDALVLSFPLIQGNNTKQDMLNIIQENIQSVKKRVVRILNKDKDYKKYGVPVNFLKITKVLITRDNMLEISLELKKV